MGNVVRSSWLANLQQQCHRKASSSRNNSPACTSDSNTAVQEVLETDMIPYVDSPLSANLSRGRLGSCHDLFPSGSNSNESNVGSRTNGANLGAVQARAGLDTEISPTPDVSRKSRAQPKKNASRKLADFKS